MVGYGPRGQNIRPEPLYRFTVEAGQAYPQDSINELVI